MRRATSLVAVSVLLLCACGRGPESPRATVRDSAGIAIVENPSLPEPDSAGWHVTPQPALTLGVVDGDEAYQFDLIRAAARLSDGTIAVADGGSSQIRFFDDQGRYLRSAGRDGDGPGEFRFISDMFARPGDSLLVVSGNTGTAYSIIPPGAEFPAPIAFVTAFYYPTGILADGRTVHLRYANSVAYDAVGLVRDSVLIVIADLPAALAPSGEARVSSLAASSPVQLSQTSIPADTLVRVPGNEEFRRAVGNGISNTGVAFGRRIEMAVQGNRVLIGIGSEGVVQVYAPDRGLVRSIRFTGAREPLENAEIDAWKTWTRAMARNDVQREGAERFIEAISLPAERPVSGRIVVDAEGWIWLERYAVDSGYSQRMSDTPRRWYVLDPEGVATAAVDVPADFRIDEIGSDYLLGVATDGDGVQTVRMYSLRRGET